jgi:hypothetical protein
MAFRAQLDDFAGLYERTYQPVYRTVLGICGSADKNVNVAGTAFLKLTLSGLNRRRQSAMTR